MSPESLPIYYIPSDPFNVRHSLFQKIPTDVFENIEIEEKKMGTFKKQNCASQRCIRP